MTQTKHVREISATLKNGYGLDFPLHIETVAQKNIPSVQQEITKPPIDRSIQMSQRIKYS